MLNDRELATVLAALRLWQSADVEMVTSGDVAAEHLMDIATRGGQTTSLNGEEIDRLCQRLNLGLSESALVEMCGKVAESAESWAGCSDMREAMAVFRELGVECRRLVDRRHRPASFHPVGWVLYDFDANVLMSTSVYPTYAAALENAAALRDVIAVPLGLAVDDDPVDDGADAAIDPEPCECELPGYFCSGVAGIIAHVENGHLVASDVQRCDMCQRYESDTAALEKLRELGIA